jgi:hypothetical protein
MASPILTQEDLTFLDLFAKSLARQFLWSEENGRSSELRRPLKQHIADCLGVDLALGSTEEGGVWQDCWKGTPLQYRHQRLILRGLVLHYWTQIFHGQPFRQDRWAHLSAALSAFGQELID